MINTVIMTALSLVIAIPLGYSRNLPVEYANKGSKVVTVIRLTAETLSGIPSIIYVCLVCCFSVRLSDGDTPAGWFINSGNYDSSADYEDCGGSSSGSAGFLQRGVLWTWRRKAADHLPHCSSYGCAGNSLRCGSCYRKNCRRDGGSALYSGLSCPGSSQSFRFRAYAGRSHVCAFQRGLHMNEAYATAVVLLVVVLALNGLSDLLARNS